MERPAILNRPEPHRHLVGILERTDSAAYSRLDDGAVAAFLCVAYRSEGPASEGPLQKRHVFVPNGGFQRLRDLD